MLGLGRRAEKTIGFGAKRPMNYAIFRPVHEVLARDPRLDIRFFGKFLGRRAGAGKLYELAGATKLRRMTRLRARHYPFDLYVNVDFSMTAPRARKAAHLFHGISLKNRSIEERAAEFDAVFVQGPYMEREFVRRGIFREGDPRMRRVGMPKLDCLVDGSLNRADILARHGCSPERPTVLYAPTWGDPSSLPAVGEDILRRLCATNLNVIAKPHDHLLDPRRYAVDWSARLGEMARRWPALRLAFWEDVVPLLFAADVLVSDASSVCYEYLLTDRPIIFLTFPGQFETCDGADLETWGQKVGVTVGDPAQIVPTVERALAAPQDQHEVRQTALRDLLFHPGRATQRAVAEVYRLLELDPPAAEGAG